MAGKSPKVTAPRKPFEPGIYVYVRIWRGRVEVVKVTRIDNAPRWNLRAPLLTRETAARFERDAAELVLAEILADGTVVDSFGWTADPHAIADVKTVEQAIVISSGLAKLTDWEARWRIPLPESVRYLQFYRTEVTRGADGRTSFNQISLGVFDLKPGGGGPAPTLPVPTPEPPIPVTLTPQGGLVSGALEFPTAPAPLPKKKRAAVRKKKKGKSTDAVTNGGFIKTSVMLLNNGDPTTKFNIVILGDGFTNASLPVFNTHAQRLKSAFTTKEPFKSLKSRINIYKISVVSSESGIANCPKCTSAPPKNTYFQTMGCWNGMTSGTFVGTASYQKIFDAVETVIPQHFAHLVVTLVNCPGYGGSAPPELGLVFLTITDPPVYPVSQFKDLALHEAGHVIADLCEEYNPCNEKDPLRPYPNEATQADVDAGTVRWKNLALPGELDAAGNLKVVHRFGDAVKARCQPALTAAQLKSLGAFWGCHNGDSHAPVPYPAPMEHCDPRGQMFYRPMANCRMRDIDSEFCRYCNSLVTERITDVSTP